EEVRELFEQYGTVQSIKLITDHVTGRFRGFGFVEMEPFEADAAIQALNGIEFYGRRLRVEEAGKRRTRRHPPRR
ncbi:MAG: RNA-binding protein, partial [bacterium]